MFGGFLNIVGYLVIVGRCVLVGIFLMDWVCIYFCFVLLEDKLRKLVLVLKLDGISLEV